jgi:hypothetical protein
LSWFKRNTFDTIINNVWEDLSNFREDGSFSSFARENLGCENRRYTRFVLAPIGMEL